LRIILDIVPALTHSEVESYADIGCSNGFITKKIADRLNVQHAYGFDHSDSLLDEARSCYPDLEFAVVNLNEPVSWGRQFHLVSCFETLEHVGNLGSAVGNLAAAVAPGGILVVSVPIEIGLWGTCKFLCKAALGYRLDELPGPPTYGQYLSALLAGRRMSEFREVRSGWSTHFGFDYRDVEDLLAESSMEVQHKITRKANRLLVARKSAGPDA
jgi:SAM-dependent methyltransferase